eukprot:TRINITY_DN781786_c0_g1_i1.p1 TRINITY_DN781786_c0_g1~~TRINITY_DN781786_c0_g1_i1.p1  ORF type:complete len:315 (+),score=65.83 TRINITY_DN781786_c0_g1_i1:45-989(+)
MFPKSMIAPSAQPVHDASYYAKCMLGGVLSCGLTHTAICPLDVVKCNMQTNPKGYPNLTQGFKNMKAEGGLPKLTRGWAPTLIGYSMQGLCKFGFYEIFKDLYANVAGPELAHQYRTSLYLAASASAELIADVALCPMESVKVRVQTTPAELKFPTKLAPATKAILADEGVSGLFKGLSPLWMRQVPYTMVKFACFERVVEAFYTYAFKKPKAEYAKSTQLSITFASGYIAGVFCAIVSHPADTVVSKLNQEKGGSIGGIVKNLGMKGIWRGLGARIIMIGTLTGLQWWIYDSFKTAMGMGTTGGSAPVEKKEE